MLYIIDQMSAIQIKGNLIEEIEALSIEKWLRFKHTLYEGNEVAD